MTTAKLNTDILKSIKLLALDVDGVLSDGKLYFSAQGDEIKSFSTLDGHGIKQLQQNGIIVAIITGRSSPLVAKRARDLGIQHLIQGREDKKQALKEICETLSLGINECAYMGDDLPDLAAMLACGYGLTVPNAHAFVAKHADYCTKASGGHGAVREVADLILEAKGLLESIHNKYLGLE